MSSACLPVAMPYAYCFCKNIIGIWIKSVWRRRNVTFNSTSRTEDRPRSYIQINSTWMNNNVNSNLHWILHFFVSFSLEMCEKVKEMIRWRKTSQRYTNNHRTSFMRLNSHGNRIGVFSRSRLRPKFKSRGTSKSSCALSQITLAAAVEKHIKNLTDSYRKIVPYMELN